MGVYKTCELENITMYFKSLLSKKRSGKSEMHELSLAIKFSKLMKSINHIFKKSDDLCTPRRVNLTKKKNAEPG